MQNLNLTDPNQIIAMSLTLAFQEAVKTGVIAEPIGVAVLARADTIRLAITGGATVNVIDGLVEITPRENKSLVELLAEAAPPAEPLPEEVKTRKTRKKQAFTEDTIHG